MFSPTVPFLRQAISAAIEGFSIESIRSGLKPRKVLRIFLMNGTSPAVPPSVILKITPPIQLLDSESRDREFRIYRDCLEHLRVPHSQVLYSGLDSESQSRLLILEDLQYRYRFPPIKHRWTWEDIGCAMRVYARLHVEAVDILPPPAKRYWMFSYMTPAWTAESILGHYQSLRRHHAWPPIPGLEKLAQHVLAALPGLVNGSVTMVHHDAWPSNIALPLNRSGEALLVDWEMGGWGMPEIDLAYLFLDPFQATRGLQRPRVLDYYWSQRQRLESIIPPAEERRYRQHLADGLLALSELPIAHHVAENPYPPESFLGEYWQAMPGVLLNRLKVLSTGTPP